MRRLTARRRPRRDDRGAVALLVAVLLPVMLLIAAGFVVDVGSWYSVRAQSQNGADAAALAVAQSCAADTCDQDSAQTLATGYSDENSNHNFDTGGASATLVCGNATGLDSCAQDPSCRNVSQDPTSHYVTVQTVSNQKVGLFGSLSGSRTKIGACAQVAWGAAGYPGGGIAITVSECQWSEDTGDGATYAPAPAYPPYPDSARYPEHLITLGHIGDPTDCTPPQGNSALPGGFGEVLPDGASQCTTTINSDGWYDQNTGNGNDNHWVSDCSPVVAADRDNQTIVEVPVFDDVAEQGSNGQYHLSNLAAFVVTAYKFKTGGGPTVGSYIPGSPYTKSALKGNGNGAICPDTCIVGYYVRYSDPNPPIGSGQNYGVTVPPKLVG